MFDTIRQAGLDYYNSLPDNMARSIALSAVISFTFTAMYLKSPGETINLNRPLIAAAVASTASTMHALAEPFFREVFGSWNGYICAEFSKSMIITVLTSALYHNVTTSNPSMSFVVFSLYSVNLILAVLKGQQQTDNSIYFLTL